jgi:hypothetical protein
MRAAPFPLTPECEREEGERRRGLRRLQLIATAFVVLLFAPAPVLGGGAGTYLAPFLEVEGGARQIGLGGAFTGLADDAMAVFYNPAGLRFLEGSEIHLSTSSWPAGMSYQHLSYGFRHSVVPGYFAISWTIMQMAPYREKTEYYDPESVFGIGTLGNVDAGDMAFGGSYCWALSKHLSVGTTAKWYHLAMADAVCEGLCGDFGVLYDTPFRNLRLGASAMNLGPSNRWSGTGSETNIGETFPMPTTYRVGASMRIFDVVTHRVVVAADYKYPRSGESKLNLGTEYTFNKGPVFVYGRVGYRLGYDEEGLTLGLGALFPSSQESAARVDYAYIDMGDLNYAQRVAVSFLF